MFKSLFGFFNGKSSTPIFDDEINVVFAYETLSQSELQMLQRLVAERIQAEDTSRRSAIAVAKVYPNDYDMQDCWYRLANKSSVKISKLAKLQYRLKHRIVAKG